MIQYSQVESPMSPQSFLSVVRKRAKLITWLFIVIFAAVALVTLLIKPVYRAKAKVMVNYMLDHEKAHLLNLYRVSDETYYDRLNSEKQIFKMYNILAPVVSAFGLSEQETDPERRQKFESAVTELEEDIRVDRHDESNVLEVSYENNNPELAAQIVERVVHEYIQKRPRLNRDERSLRLLDKQIATISTQIDTIQRAGMEYKRKRNLIEPDRQANILFNSLSDFDQTLTRVRSDRIAREAQLQVIREQLAQGEHLDIPTLKSSESYSRFDFVNKLKKELMDLKLEEKELARKYTAQHPKLQEIRAKVANLKQQRDQEVREIIKAEDAAIKSMRVQEQALAERMEEVVNSIANLSKQEYELGQLTIGVEDLESVHSMLIRQRKEAELATEKQEHLVRVQLLEPAMIPQHPVKPNRPLYLALGLFLAIVVAFGTAFIVEYFDHSVNTAEDAQNCLGLPILASIPEFQRSYATRYRRSSPQSSRGNSD